MITHGLPYPENLALAQDMEAVVRAGGAVSATIAVIAGEIRVGLDQQTLEQLAQTKNVRKISVRDLPPLLPRTSAAGPPSQAIYWLLNRSASASSPPAESGAYTVMPPLISRPTSPSLPAARWWSYAPEPRRSWICPLPWNSLRLSACR